MARVMELWRKHLKRVLEARSPRDWLLGERVLVVGAGGVGTWFTLTYAMHADPEKTTIIVVDGDNLEEVNANRLPYPYVWFLDGKPKAAALAEYIAMIRPGLRVDPVLLRVSRPEELAALIRTHEPTVIVDAVDNVPASRLIAEARDEHAPNTPLLSIHYDGTHYTVEWYPGGKPAAGWTADEQAGQGYTVPSTAVTPMAIAILALGLLRQRPQEYVAITGDLDA